MTERGKVTTHRKPDGVFAIEKPKSRKEYFTKFFDSLFRPYGAILKKKAKFNSVIEDLDEKKDPMEQETSVIRDVVVLRKIQKVMIEALNVCPDECINDLHAIYNVLKQDLPNPEELEIDFYKKVEEKSSDGTEEVEGDQAEKDGNEEEGESDGKRDAEKQPERSKLKEYLAESVEKMKSDIQGAFDYLEQFAAVSRKSYKRDFVSEFKGMRTHYLLQTGENKDFIAEDEGEGEEEDYREKTDDDKSEEEEHKPTRGILKKDGAQTEERRNSSSLSRRSSKVVQIQEEEDDKTVNDHFNEFEKSLEKEEGNAIEINQDDIKLEADDIRLNDANGKEAEEDKNGGKGEDDLDDDLDAYNDDEFNYENSNGGGDDLVDDPNQEDAKEEDPVDDDFDQEPERKKSTSQSRQSGEESITKELVIVEGFKTVDESQTSFNEAEIKSQCEGYFNKLEPIFTDSFKSSWNDISSSLENCDREVIITFREKETNQLKGLAILCINQAQAEILHISTLKQKDFVNACSMACNYAKNNSVIKDITIAVDHRELEIDGKKKTKMDPFFKEKLKEIGFKWLKLQNSGGRRYTVFRLKQGSESNEASNNTLMRLSTGKIQVSKVFIDHLIIMSDTLPNCSNLVQADGLFESSLGEFFALKKFKEISAKGRLNGWLNGKVAVPLKKELPEEKLDDLGYSQVDLDEDAAIVQADFCEFQLGSEIEILPDFLAEKTEAYAYKSKIDIKFARPAVYEVESQSTEFLRIGFNSKIMRMRNDEMKANVVVAPTTNERYLYFFIHFDDDEYLDTLGSLSQFRKELRDIFDSMEPTEKDEMEDIWIPNFKFLVTTEDISSQIGRMSEMPKLMSLFRVELRGSHEGEIITRRPSENSIMINKKFVFGISDTQLDESTGIPLFSCVVTKNQFIRTGS